MPKYFTRLQIDFQKKLELPKFYHFKKMVNYFPATKSHAYMLFQFEPSPDKEKRKDKSNDAKQSDTRIY